MNPSMKANVKWPSKPQATRKPKGVTIAGLMQFVAFLGVMMACGIVWPEPERVISQYEKMHGPGVVVQDIETGIECQIWPVPYGTNQVPHRECRLTNG